MKICERGLNWFQIYNYKGDVRLCGWRDGYIGNLMEHSIHEIWHGERAQEIRRQLLADDYSRCNIDACPYLANHEMDKRKVEYNLPEYPRELMLAYENVCNYRCTSCTIQCTMPKEDWKAAEERCNIIDDRIREVLPHVEFIGANGHGEVFTSKHILKILSEWKPLHPERARALLETNGSLFDAEHWQPIANLGQYHLNVAITVMSFDEYTYQALSGCRYPIQKILDNLAFVADLRRKGIVNYFELATVVQEQNFRTLPEFVRRCLSYEPDCVRVRPYGPWGEADPDTMWFKDMRGKHHPFFEEYMRIIQDPILKDPRVYNWGGNLASRMGDLPRVELREKKMLYAREQEKSAIIERLLAENGWKTNVSGKRIVVYGLRVLGKVLVHLLQGEHDVVGVLDKHSQEPAWQGLPVVTPDHAPEAWRDVTVIVTPLGDTSSIHEELEHLGFKHIVDIKELFCQ